MVNNLIKLVKIIILIVVSLFVISCDKDDISVENQIKISSYHTSYMDFSHLKDWEDLYMPSTTLNPDADGLVELDYESGKILKKKGGYGYHYSLGFHFFSSQIVDEVSYNKNKIRIEKKSYSPTIHIHPNLRTIELDNNGLMVKKINNIVQNVLSSGDTIYNILTKEYTYNSEKLLVKMRQTQKLNYSEHTNPPDNIRSYADASYYYTNNNLDSIVTIEHDYVEQENTYIPKRKIVETFSNYDDSENPLKSLFIFEETFKRSLSNNNYGTYKKDEYYFIDEIVMHSSSYQNSWILNYDINGNIRFDL